MSRREEIADVLDGAADVIERDGHYKGWLVGQDDSVCVMGALGRTCGLLDGRNWADVWGDDVWQPIKDARDALANVVPALDDELITDWNDAPERTKQEVLDALRLAAKQERRAADSEDGAL